MGFAPLPTIVADAVMAKLENMTCDAGSMGHNYIGHDYVGHNYIGHNYIGHNYIGHNYIGHNWLGVTPAARRR